MIEAEKSHKNTKNFLPSIARWIVEGPALPDSVTCRYFRRQGGFSANSLLGLACYKH